jgi:hypothetical protein
MKTLATNQDFDIYLGPDGNLAITDGLEAVKQTCEHVSRTRLAELPYAQSRGIPFFTVGMGTDPDTSLYDMYLRKALMTVPDVIGVASINFTLDGEVLSYTAEIKTIYGMEKASGNL